MKQPNEITLQVKIANGGFTGNTTTLKEVLRAYEGMTVDLTFKKRINKRTVKQNAYYWSSIVPIWRNVLKVEWGELWDAMQVHEFLKERLNYDEKVAPNTGEIIRITRSTKDNTTEQQTQYHQKCVDLAKEFFNIDIPPPKQQVTMKFDR